MVLASGVSRQRSAASGQLEEEGSGREPPRLLPRPKADRWTLRAASGLILLKRSETYENFPPPATSVRDAERCLQ